MRIQCGNYAFESTDIDKVNISLASIDFLEHYEEEIHGDYRREENFLKNLSQNTLYEIDGSITECIDAILNEYVDELFFRAPHQNLSFSRWARLNFCIKKILNNGDICISWRNKKEEIKELSLIKDVIPALRGIAEHSPKSSRPESMRTAYLVVGVISGLGKGSYPKINKSKPKMTKKEALTIFCNSYLKIVDNIAKKQKAEQRMRVREDFIKKHSVASRKMMEVVFRDENKRNAYLNHPTAFKDCTNSIYFIESDCGFDIYEKAKEINKILNTAV